MVWDQEGLRSKRGGGWPYGVLLAMSVLLTWPGIIYGIPGGHDAANHIVWQIQFSRQFWTGDIYPRWLMDMHAGLGSPVFYFYGPLPFFIGSLIYPGCHLFLTPLQLVGLCAALSIFLSGIGTYLWLKDSLARRTALMGAVIYMALPYHLYVNYYVRFAYGELWAMSILPFLIWCAERVARGKPFAVPACAVFYALLILSHMPSTLLFSPLLVIYPLVIAPLGTRGKTLARIGSGMSLGIALAAVYFIPAMALQDTVRMQSMASGKYQFDRNFLFNFGERRNSFQSHLRFMNVWTIHAFVLWLVSVFFCFSRFKGRTRQAILFWCVVGLGSLLMMLPPSQGIWRVLPILQKIQFPWRFHILFSLALLLLMVHALRTMGRKRLWAGRRPGVVILIVLVVLLLPLVLNALLHPKDPLPVSTRGFHPVQRHKIETNMGAKEYVPKGSSTKLLDKTTLSLPPVRITSGKGIARVEAWAPRRIVLDIIADSPLELTLKQYYYPGWAARKQDEQILLTIYPTPGEGLLGVSVPEGRSRVMVQLEKNQAEKIGWLVSGVALLVWLWIIGSGLVDIRRNRKTSA